MNCKMLNYIRCLCIIMPLIDTLNGMLMGDSSTGGIIGQIYRSGIFLLLLLQILEYRKVTKKLFLLFLFFITLMVAKTYFNINMTISEMGGVIKIVLPIIIIDVLAYSFQKHDEDGLRYVRRIMDRISLITPFTILIPFILGVGRHTYEGEAGFKGFYFATNEISFLIDVILLYLLFEFKPSLQWGGKFILGVSAGFLVGTKTVLLTCLICLYIALYFFMRKASISYFYKILIIGIPCLVMIYFAYDLYEQFYPLLVRWEFHFNKHESEGILYFLTSGRSARVEMACNNFFSSEIENILFGLGVARDFDYVENCEMDLFDLMFGIGVVGCFIVVLYYAYYIMHNIICIAPGMLFVLFYLCIIIFAGGHVLNTGLGGMSFSFIIVYLHFKQKINKTVL